MATAIPNLVLESEAALAIGGDSARPERVGTNRLRSTAWRTLGTACFVIGTVNAFVPLLPTTVFWIVAVWAFSRSSPQLARFLLDHPRFGPGLRQWRDHRMISRHAKVLACSAIGVSYAITLASLGVSTLTLLLGAGLGGLILYLATRPEPPAELDVRRA